MMCKSKRACAYFLSVGILFGCAHLYAQEQQASESADQEITDFSLAGFGEKGKKNWDISGKSANIMADTVKLKDVVGNLYGEKENIKLSAEKGAYNKSDGKVYLEKNVLIATSSGATLATESLNWDRKNELVETKDEVNIAKENFTAKAQGAVGRPNLNTVSLEKDVEVNINTPENKAAVTGMQMNQMTITCEGPMEIDYQKSIAVFNKKVKVETKDASIASDMLEVYFVKSAKETNAASTADIKSMGSQVDRIKAYGNVTIIRGENISHSDEAVYTAADNKITLSGKPKLVIYSAKDMDSVLQNK